MTQDQLATAASTQDNPISQALISALEKRDSETTAHLFAFAKALRINPEWLQTGAGDSGLDAEAWKPPSPDLERDEAELMKDYRRASEAWKLTIRLMARTPTEEQPQISRDVNILLTTIFGPAASDARVEEANKTSPLGAFPNRKSQKKP